MKRKLTLCLIAVLSILTVLSAVTAQASGDFPQANEYPRHEACSELSAQAKAYYTGLYSYENLFSLSGASNADTSWFAALDNPLYDRLHSLMADTQTYFTTYSGYKKGSLAYYWASTDAVSSGATYTMFYSDAAGDDDGITMNREHIWPKSRASFYQKNGGSDLHHLRPSVSTVNSAKSDHFFGYVSGAYADGYTVGKMGDAICYYLKKTDDVFECKDDVKGDVARILLYVYCRWEQPNLYTDMSDHLPVLDPDDSQNKGLKVIESLDTLLQWCETDPVDTWEMRRNDLTQQVQGNRNVFIDYPELAWKLFGREIPDEMSTPTHQGCEHHYCEIQREEPSCTSDGAFILECDRCGNTLERKIICLGHIDSEKDGVCDRCSEKFVNLILGDADGDGEVTLVDSTLIQHYLAGMTEHISMKTAQVRGIELDIVDAAYIARYVALMDTSFRIGAAI